MVTDRVTQLGISDKYIYGNKGQVIRNDHRGIEDDTTFTFSYDNRGNIRHQKQYDYTTDSLSGETVNDDLQFSYDYDNDVWLDAIDSVGDDDSYLMRYDANGNPVDVSDMHFHWTNGRMLDSITYTDDRGVEQPFMSFTYDDNGIRTSKTFGDTTTYYTNVDGAITSQYCLDEDGAVTDLMQFLYDGSNELLGFTYNGATYFYVKNLQGDVIAVIDSAGAEKAVYEYGAYGRLIYSDGDLADVNPMRYRGYYYDSDAGMYYLQSRYYAPEFAKFINSDLPEYAQQQKADHYGTNLFAYCCNDPVNNSDPTGYWGEDLHNGYSKNNSRHTYILSYNGNLYEYGTFYWAKDTGYCVSYAKYIAKKCSYVDKYYSVLVPTRKNQEWHFNINANTDNEDSRKLCSERAKKKAKIALRDAQKQYNIYKRNDITKNEKKEALKNCKKYLKKGLKYIGFAIHPIQDIYAHTDSVVKWNKVNKFWYHNKTVTVDGKKIGVDKVSDHKSVVINKVQPETRKILKYFINNYWILKKGIKI